MRIAGGTKLGVIVLVAGTIAALLLVLLLRERAIPRTPVRALGAHEAPEEDGRTGELERGSRQPAPDGETVGAFLREFWGEDWADAEQSYADAGVELGASLRACGLQAWEEVVESSRSLARAYHDRGVPVFRAQFLLPLGDHPELIFSHFELEEGVDRASLLQQAELEVEDIEWELQVLCDQYIAELDRAVEQTLAREPERYPLVDLRSEGNPPGSFYGIDVEVGGWYVTYPLSLEDHPVLATLRDEGSELKKERMKRLHEFMRAQQQD